MDGTRYKYNTMEDLYGVSTLNNLTFVPLEARDLSVEERILEADTCFTDSTRNPGRRLVRARYVLFLTHRDRHYAYIRELRIVGPRHK